MLEQIAFIHEKNASNRKLPHKKNGQGNKGKVKISGIHQLTIKGATHI